MAELYSVLTKLKVTPRVSPKDAEMIVTSYWNLLKVEVVTPEITRAAVVRCANKNLLSGAIFDALHLLAAEASRADVMLTFNVFDFQRLSDSASPRIVEPPSPPSLTL
jgi:hypothetical protein